MSAPAHVHAQRVLHSLRDVEITLRGVAGRLPGDPGVAELVSQVGVLRVTIERAFEDLA